MMKILQCVVYLVTEGELEIVLEIHRDGSPWSGSNEDKYVSPPKYLHYYSSLLLYSEL